MDRSKHIALTGGAGFIGSNVARALNGAGTRNLYIVDHLLSDLKKKHLAGVAYEKYFERDEFLKMLSSGRLADLEVMIHLGACTDTTIQDEEFFKKNNTQYSKTLFDYALAHGVRFIYASSAATYGAGEKGFSDRLRDLLPLNLYGYSKYWFDEIVWQAPQKPPQWVGLKFFNVYGPYEEHKGKMASLVYQGYQEIVTNGEIRLFKASKSGYEDGGEKRDFVYVKDVVKVIMFFLKNAEKSGIFNVGTGKARSFRDLALGLFSASGVEPKITFFEMPNNIQGKYQYFTKADLTSLRWAGFKESFYELEDGVSDYVKNYLKRDL